MFQTSLVMRMRADYWPTRSRKLLSSLTTVSIEIFCSLPILVYHRTVRGFSSLVFAIHSEKYLTGLMKKRHAHSTECNLFVLLLVIFPLLPMDISPAVFLMKELPIAGYAAGIVMQCQMDRRMCFSTI